MKPQPVINVTPLIDVLLVLLIIFMVISPVKPHRFAAQIPEKDSADKHERSLPSVVVNIAADGSLRLNNQALKSDELKVELAKLMSERPSDARNVFISGAASLSYQSVVRIVDIAKTAGAQRQGLVVDQVN